MRAGTRLRGLWQITKSGGRDPHEVAVRISGRVKWFDAGKGYGFIVPDDPSQTGLGTCCCMSPRLRNAGRDGAPEGAIMVCDVVKRPKGWQVPEIVELDEPRRRRAEERPRRAFDGDAAAPVASAVTAVRPPTRQRRRWPPAPRRTGATGVLADPDGPSSAPRSSGSTAPRAMASWSGRPSPATSSSISRRCAAAALEDLQPGEDVRVRFAEGPKGLVVAEIELGQA